MHYDRQGNPITLEQWSRMFGDEEYKRIAKTDLPGGGHVSTVWMGLDHGFGGLHLIFETMVFGHPGADNEQERYSTEQEARAGHEEMVAKWSPKQ